MWKIHNAVILVLSLIMLSTPTLAQQIVGTANINGRTIEILNNQTWRYKSPQNQNSSDCETLKSGVLFCNINNWKVTSPSGDISHMYMIDDRTYLMFIIEGFGSEDGVTKNYMAQVAIDHAAAGGNTTSENIIQHFSRDTTINGNDFLTIAYNAKISNIDLTFVNNIYVGEKVTVQAGIYTVGSQVSEKLITLSETLVKNLTFPN
jgi:hypothetical protein